MSKRRLLKLRHRIPATLCLSAALGACGGGEILALLQIVTPLAGQWNDASFRESVSFLTPLPEGQVYLPQVNVTALVTSGSGVCGDFDGSGVNVQGTLDSGKLSLRLPAASSACLEGSFVNLVRLDSVAKGTVPGHSYFNTQVDVRMSEGLWSTPSGALKLKFQQPSSVDNNGIVDVTGCDVSAAAKVSFAGSMQGYNTASGANPQMAELRNTATSALLFRQIEFVDGATITLVNPAGQSLTLKRQVDPANTSCL